MSDVTLDWTNKQAKVIETNHFVQIDFVEFRKWVENFAKKHKVDVDELELLFESDYDSSSADVSVFFMRPLTATEAERLEQQERAQESVRVESARRTVDRLLKAHPQLKMDYLNEA